MQKNYFTGHITLHFWQWVRARLGGGEGCKWPVGRPFFKSCCEFRASHRCSTELRALWNFGGRVEDLEHVFGFLKPFLNNLQCGRVYYSKRGHCPLRILNPWMNHMNGWIQGFPAECCQKHHTSSAGFLFFSIAHPDVISSPDKLCKMHPAPHFMSGWKCNSSVLQFQRSQPVAGIFGRVSTGTGAPLQSHTPWEQSEISDVQTWREEVECPSGAL